MVYLHVCLYIPAQKRVLGSLGTGVMNGCEPPWGPLGKRPALPTAVPPLQPSSNFLKNHFKIVEVEMRSIKLQYFIKVQWSF